MSSMLSFLFLLYIIILDRSASLRSWSERRAATYVWYARDTMAGSLHQGIHLKIINLSSVSTLSMFRCHVIVQLFLMIDIYYHSLHSIQELLPCAVKGCGLARTMVCKARRCNRA